MGNFKSRFIATAGMLLPVTAQAACPAANLFSFTFNTAPAASLNYGSSYNYTASNSLGQNMTFTVSWVTNGLTTNSVGGAALPAINNLINDTTGNNNLMVGGGFASRTANITSGVRVVTTNFTFATPVRDFQVQMNDVDFGANQFRDWIHISGTSPAGTYVPSITTPYTNNNGAGPRSDASSTITLGSAVTPYAISSSEGVGTAVSANTNVTNGTIFASWVQPVTTASVIYGNYPLTTGESVTGVQAVGFETVTFCAMPQLTVTKTVAPWSDPVNGTTNPKMIPGSDVNYTITVTNSNASTLDGADLPRLVDLLASTLTFYNGDIDDAGPLTTNYEFIPGTSGLSFAPANVTYSNNGGATYVYAPAAGYDANVNGLRFAPTGTFNANSSFSIRFRAQIK